MPTKPSGSLFLLAVVSGLLLIAVLSAFTTAVPADVPPRPTLIPSPTLIPTPIGIPLVTRTPTAVPPTAVPPANPAAIYLNVEPATAGLWTVVQWRDGDQWRNVEGWQSPLNEDGVVAWAVAAENFGERPFRWLIYDGPGGALLRASDSFALPGFAHETIHITVTLP